MRDVVERLQTILDLPKWAEDYDQSDARADVSAGLTVGVMLIPQGMAYAVIAGLPPIYGLYAGLVPLLIYPILATSRQLSIGPIAIDMVIIAAGVSALAAPGSSEYIALAILLTAMVGVMQLFMSAIRFGFVADMLSRPVIDGFTAAAALIIAFSQLGNLLGVELESSQYIYVLIWEAWERLYAVNTPSLMLGLGGIVLILLVQRFGPMLPDALIAVVVGIAVTWGFDLEPMGVDVVGTVPEGLPGPELPDISMSNLRDLLPTALTLALVQFMSVISLSRVFASKHRYPIDANKELMALGTANFVGSFFRSMPISGSFSRSAVNDQAGARSPIPNVIAAFLVGLTLLLLTPLFYYLPMPILASIIIVAAVGLIDLKELKLLFRIRKREGFVALFTFACTIVIGIQEGILLGVAASTLVVLHRISRPEMAELGHLKGTRSFRDLTNFQQAEPIEGILVLRVNAAFSFANAEHFKDFILKKSRQEVPKLRAVIIDGASINDMDTTAIEALDSIIDTLQAEDIDLYFTGLIGMVRELMQRSELYQRLGADHFHRNPHQAVRHVLATWDRDKDSNRLSEYLAATDESRLAAQERE